MKTNNLSAFVLALAWASLASSWLCADQATDEAMIRKSVETYVKAFNNRDAKSIAALWSPDAVYTNRATGETVSGRTAIQKELESVFADSKDAKLEVEVTSVSFLSPSVAIEKGIARVIQPGAAPDETVYSSVYVKSGDAWLLDHMTEEPKPVFRSNYQHLKDLEWTIGTWVDQDESSRIETISAWTKNQNFISRRFSAEIDGEPELSGVQIIGWDPNEKEIRSWVFDSDGGFGSSTWKKKDDTWVINSTATLADGRKASATRIITLVDKNKITWRAVSRTLDGEILPNIDPIPLTRKPADSE